MVSKTGFAVVALLALATLSFAVSSALGSSLYLAGLKYYPYPAQAGKYFDLFVSAQANVFPSYEVQCELAPEYPFSFDENETASRYVGAINGGQSFVMKFRVRTDSAAIPGDNKLKFKCKTSSSDWISAELTVSVQPQEASLAVTKVEVVPERISPGEKAVISVTVENEADSSARDARLRLDLNTTNLAPLNSADEQIIGLLRGRQSNVVEFQVVALPSAPAGVYKIPFTLSYSDELGNKYSKSSVIGVRVGSKPVLSIVADAGPLFAGESAVLKLKIFNEGLGDAKFLNAELGDVQGMLLFSPKKYYVGSLDSDDSDVIEFKAFVESGVTVLKIPLSLEFRDANNDAYSQEQVLEARVYSREEAAKYGLAPAPGVPWWAWLALLAAAYLAFLGYRKFVKKK